MIVWIEEYIVPERHECGRCSFEKLCHYRLRCEKKDGDYASPLCDECFPDAKRALDRSAEKFFKRGAAE